MRKSYSLKTPASFVVDYIIAFLLVFAYWPVISSFDGDGLRPVEVYKTFLSHRGPSVEYAEVGARLPFPLSRPRRLVAAQTSPLHMPLHRFDHRAFLH